MIKNQLMLNQPGQSFEILSGTISGKNVTRSEKLLNGLKNIFADEKTRASMDQNIVVYDVMVHEPVERGTEGGLLFGTTNIMAGKVGNEYFLTHGHFHKIGNRAEYYWGIGGNGILILMDKKRNYYAESMYPGSLHYIPADTAHRVCNYGDEVLTFGACWYADAGYDYEEIKQKGFSARVICVDGKPVVVPA